MSKFRSPVVAAIASAALTASVAGGVAIAQTSTPTAITACVAKRDGNVRIVGSTNDCKASETSTSWNQQGVQGPQGPQGPQGDPGPAGPSRFVDTLQGGHYTYYCAQPNTWRECATVKVHVPANKTYVVGIDSAGSYDSYDIEGYDSRVRVCTSARPADVPLDPASSSSCKNQPTGIIVKRGHQDSFATNGVNALTGGPSGTDWIVSTLLHSDQYPAFNPNSVIHTLVTVSDAG